MVLSLPLLSLLLSPAPNSPFILFSLSRSYLSFHLYLSPTPVFLIFLSHTLSLFLSFLSFSLPSLSLSSFSHSYLSLVLSLSLSSSHPRLSFSFSNPYFSLSHSCISFHLFSHPCRLPLFLPLMSPFLSLSHPCLSFSLSVVLFLPPLSLFLSFSLPPMSHFFISFSVSLTPVSLSWLDMSQSCRMVSTVIYFYYITLIIYISYYLVFKTLSAFVRDSSYYDCTIRDVDCCAHTKSFLTQQFHFHFQSEAWDPICMYIIVHAFYTF